MAIGVAQLFWAFSAPEEGCGVGHVDLYLHVPGKFNLSAHWLFGFFSYFFQGTSPLGRQTDKQIQNVVRGAGRAARIWAYWACPGHVPVTGASLKEEESETRIWLLRQGVDRPSLALFCSVNVHVTP